MAMEEVASTSSSTSAKRSRDQQEPWESPEAKRLREDLLFDILDGDDDEVTGVDEAYVSGDASNDLAHVMRSFEEEIAASVSPASATSSTSSSSHEDEYNTYAADASDVQRQQLGFLLEASDDELGLPPPGGEEELQQQQLDLAPVTTSEEGIYHQSPTGLEETDVAGNDNYWGFQDEDDGFMARNLAAAVGEEENWQGSEAMRDALANLDGAAFENEYGDVYLSWPSDLADYSSLVA